jgi:thioredoxin-like negative regulator of GroEL
MGSRSANRFNVRIPETEPQKVDDTAAQHVKELAGKDYDVEVVGSALPVVVHFYAPGSKTCEALAPRSSGTATRRSPRASASR